MRYRVSLKGLMAFVVLAGIGFTALRSGSLHWFSAFYSLTVLALFGSVLLARYRGPFWFGFALWGWGFFLLGIDPWWSGTERYGMDKALNGNLPTSWMIERITYSLIPEPLIEPHLRSHTEISAYMERFGCTQAIPHLLATLLVATIGGGFAAYLSATRDRA